MHPEVIKFMINNTNIKSLRNILYQIWPLHHFILTLTLFDATSPQSQTKYKIFPQLDEICTCQRTVVPWYQLTENNA